MLYNILRKILFLFEPEFSHRLGLFGLRVRHRLGIRHLLPVQERTVMGLQFANPIGLAAGLAKNAPDIDALGSLGFGFIEVGCVTPKAQPGNPKPRLFRLPKSHGLINRMGFNNEGVAALVSHLKNRHYQGIIGVNIGKNKDTPITKAINDYLLCFRAVYAYCDYVTVNISSPNTPGLRELQHESYLQSLLSSLKQEQQQLTNKHGCYVPIAVKIAPDLTTTEIKKMAQFFLKNHIDAIVATNTTTLRDAVASEPLAAEQGGLSGAPLFTQSCAIIREFHQHLGNEIPIIGVGGIMNGEDAQQMIDAGASLLQVYTGVIYRGPTLLKEMSRVQFNSVTEERNLKHNI